MEEEHNELIEQLSQIIHQFDCIDNALIYGSLAGYECTFGDQNNRLLPINDIDIILTSKNKVDCHKIRKIIIETTGVPRVDIKLVRINYFNKLRKSVFSYDLFNRYINLKGELQLCDKVFDAKLIPFKEIEILFRTRLWTLLGSISWVGQLQINSPNEFLYQITKCIFAIIDCRLILEGKYVTKYAQKAKLGMNYLPDFKKHIKMADEIKKGHFDKINIKGFQPLYKEVSEKFLAVFELGLQSFFKTSLPMENLLNQKYANSIYAKAKQLYYSLKYKDGKYIYPLIIIQYSLIKYFNNSTKDVNSLIHFANKHGFNCSNIEDLRKMATEIRPI